MGESLSTKNETIKVCHALLQNPKFFSLLLQIVAAGAIMQRFGRSGNADGFWASNTVFAANPGMNSRLLQTMPIRLTPKGTTRSGYRFGAAE